MRSTRFVIWGAVAGIMAFAPAGSTRTGSLQVHTVPLRSTEAMAAAAQPRVHMGPSRRQVLAARRRGVDDASSLRVLAIRVDFPPPRPDDGCAVSGDGAFDLSGEDTADRYPGSPPHNKTYFEGVLDALSRYYAVQSHGMLRIESRVVPDGEDDAYRMPHRVAYYSYYQNPSDLLEREDRLARLAADAVRAADDDSSVVLGDFDVYILFHSGGDWQHDYAGDSPCDLITAYIPSLSTFLGSPIMVDDSTHAVDDIIVMPEAINQDLDPTAEIACIHSELAHEFGHQLGLLDLYDYAYYSNMVGYWALMDNGDGMAFQDQSGRILSGVLPPSLCAFSKQMLGWVTPEELTTEGTYDVMASTLGPSAYRITMSASEQFLIENRQVDTDGDPTVYLKTDHGVILGPASAESDTTTSEYDAGLPGSGLLIWHIDTAVGLWDWGLPNILEYDAAADTLIRHRGVALEEADGLENIGLQYFETGSRPPGVTDVDPAGTAGDPFRAGHNDRFGDNTRPASWDNAGRHTHVEVSAISASGRTMSFAFRRSWQQDGWPVSVAIGPLTPPTVVHTASGQAVVLAAGRGRAYAVDAGGLPTPLWDSSQLVVNPLAAAPVDDERQFIVAMSAQGGRLGLFPLRGPDGGTPLPGWPHTPTGRALSAPVLVDADGDGVIEVAVGSADGAACVLTVEGSMAPGWPVVLGDTPVGPPAVADLDGDTIADLIFCADGVTALRYDGTVIPGWPALQGTAPLYGPLSADLEGDGVADIVVASGSQVWVLGPDGAVLPGWPATALRSLARPLMVVDVDGDRVLDIAALDTLGSVWAWSSRGDLLADCSGSPPGDGPGAGTLLGLDADVDSRIEFLTQGGTGVQLRRTAGTGVPGWPLAVSALTGAVLADLDGDNDLEIILSDSLGSLHAWDLPYPKGPGWFSPWGDAAHTGWAGVGSAPAWPAAALVSADEFYCWPSPVVGPDANISFRARAGVLIGISILDATGRLKAQWQGEATGQRQDWRWPVSAPMGVYLCRLEAQDRGARETHIQRFAVIGEN